ncbi:MAG: hypothetical protein ABI791_09150 [Acidobacteriota bacterium]
MKMRKIWVSLVLGLSIAVSVAAQPRRPGTSGPPPPDKVQITATDEGDPLADFPEKGLPQPSTLGLRPSAALARSIAPRILRNDENSLAVLTAALQKAGFHIIDSNQKILFRPTSPPIGAAFYDFEVAGMLRATGFGAVTTIDKLGKLIAHGDPDLTRANFSNLILRDIRSSLSSRDAQAQFIGTLIVELGKGTSNLATAGPADARINLIQTSLIERVFLGDMLDAFETFSEQNASLLPVRRMFDDERGTQFIAASWRPNVPAPCDDVADITKVAGIEGKIKKVGGKIFDKESIPSVFTAPKEAIKKRFENLAKGIEGANLVMSYVKVVLANMNIRADITVQDPMPLIRTKRTDEYDQWRTVTAKFRIDFKHADTINCVGKALKTATGMEVEVPKDGPLKDVPVKWQPVMEGTGYSKFGGYPVTLVAEDKNRKDIFVQVSDAQGVNKITMFGKPQDRNLEQEPVVPRAKKAGLTVSVATENMDASEDIPKIFWFGFEGDFGLKAIVEVVPDILAKMALKTYKVSVPVRDWQPCSDDWGGYINYTKKLSSTIVVKASRSSNGNSTGDGIRRIEKDVLVNVVLNPRTLEDIVAKKDPRPADFRVRGRYSDIFDGSREGDPCCGPEEGKYTTKFRSGSETTFLGSFKQRFGLRFAGGDRDYSLAFDFDTPPVDGEQHSFMEILDTNCPLEYAEESSEYSPTQVSLSDALMDGRYGERFVSPAGDLLQGTKQVQAPDGSTVTWEWALARCKK